jgi:ATP-dependent DNA helicase DinG
MTDDVPTVLTEVASTLPGGGEKREGQQVMAQAVARALAEQRHLVVQAGTGTGKSLAYLVPAALAGQRVVVATATKALQDQLATNDLPQVAGSIDRDLSYAVLKGRSNYLCRQRILEVGGGGDQLELAAGRADPPDADDPLTATQGEDALDGGRLADQVRRLVRWSEKTAVGDRAELPFEPHFRAWAAVSTTARECPGAYRCPSGRDCFAEEARHRASAADVVVVNTHLYGAHLASGGVVLPAHDVVVFDEAHEVEEVMTDSLGVEIGPGRFRALATTARPLLDGGPAATERVTSDVAEVGDLLQQALAPLVGQRLGSDAVAGTGDGTGSGANPAERAVSASGRPVLSDVLALGTGRVSRLVDALRRSEREADDPSISEQTRRDRALLAAGHLASDLARVTAPTDDEVAWVDRGSRAPSLRLSPIDVGPLLSEKLWGTVTGVLTSATVPLGLTRRLGLPVDDTDELDVGSPFDYPDHALLYVAGSLPDRRRPESEPALHDELEALITAAGGRTLALFTSWRAMRAAVEALAGRLPFPLLSQADRPKPALLEAFTADEATCLFATLGFWQGVDVPGRTLSLVTIDRIPFPRPDDPILEARRERAGSRSFSLVDLPRAGTLLAQGAGRLIRRADDRGVVAVLDSRLATARYRGDLLARVPPMRRTLDRGQVEGFLRAITTSAEPG